MFCIITPELPQGSSGVVNGVPVYFVGETPVGYDKFPIRVMFKARSLDACVAYVNTLPQVKYGPLGIPYSILAPNGRDVPRTLPNN